MADQVYCKDLSISDSEFWKPDPIIVPFISVEGAFVTVRETDLMDIIVIGKHALTLRFQTSYGHES